MVRIRKQNVICFILAVIMLGSGMCLETEKTHSFLVQSARVSNELGLAVDTTIESVPLCNSEMLGMRSRTGLQELAGRYINQKRENFLSLAFLYTDIISSWEEKFFYCLEGMPFLVRDSRELVIYYIHQSDGKKKI